MKKLTDKFQRRAFAFYHRRVICERPNGPSVGLNSATLAAAESNEPEAEKRIALKKEHEEWIRMGAPDPRSNSSNPKLEEVEAFVRDDSANGYEKLIERFRAGEESG